MVGRRRMESVREARVCRRSRCCGGSEQTLRLLECRPLCGQSHTLRAKPRTLRRNTGEGSDFARNGATCSLTSQCQSRPVSHRRRCSALPPHRSRRRLMCPFNALAPQVNAVCLWSTPRPRQRRFRRLTDVPLDLVKAPGRHVARVGRSQTTRTRAARECRSTSGRRAFR
jgi:hypothetical protein